MASKNPDPRNRTRRRELVIAAGAAFVVVGGAPWLAGRILPLTFEDVPDLAGYRRLTGGEISLATADPLIGLNAPAKPASMPSGELSHHLFPGPARAVPVAYFADFRCRNCAVLERTLDRLAAAGQLTLFRHQWPILGPASESAARAALAAGLQGRPGALDSALTASGLVPTEGYLRRIARDAGLDEGRLLRDMNAAEIDSALDRTRALAQRLGFFGTPSMVVGRTLVVGEVPEPTLKRLLRSEAARY